MVLNVGCGKCRDRVGNYRVLPSLSEKNELANAPTSQTRKVALRTMWDHTDATCSLSSRAKLDALEGALVRNWEVEDVELKGDAIRSTVRVDDRGM